MLGFGYVNINKKKNTCQTNMFLQTLYLVLLANINYVIINMLKGGYGSKPEHICHFCTYTGGV